MSKQLTPVHDFDDPRQRLRMHCEFYLEHPDLLDQLFKDHPNSQLRRIIPAVFKTYLELVPKTPVSAKTVAGLVEEYLATMREVAETDGYDRAAARSRGLSDSKADAYRFVAFLTGKTPEAVRMDYERNKRG